MYKCNTCQEKSPKLAILNKHYIDNHPPVKFDKFDTCGKAFNSPSTLERHSFPHKELKFKCEVCGDKFPFKSALESHKIKHLKEKPQKCSIKKCDKSFFNIGNLHKHKKVYLNKKWNCSMCDYVSTDKRNLKAHMRKHSNLKPYICATFLELFKYHTQLRRHLPCKAEAKQRKRSKSPEF